MPRDVSILVIDDEVLNIEFITQHFADRPFEILYAQNGDLGYEIACEAIPDLIITDWAMPILNGIDTTLKLKANEKTQRIPIIMATGVMTESKDLQYALEVGAVDFIRKPFNKLELTARVDSALALGHAMKEIREQRDEISELLEKERRELNLRLDYKERELSIKALHEQEKFQLLNEIQNNLAKLKEEYDMDGSNTYRYLTKTIKAGLKEKDDGDFLYHFQHVHPEFFKQLKVRSTDLSPTELRLCAYVKLGMRNKEIADITSTEVTSVKTSISRIKKKLDLETDISLRKFVTSLA